MKMVITDSGSIWNPDNPILRQYRDMVLVVCLYGKKVTDEYECFTYPCIPFMDLGEDSVGTEGTIYQSLEAVAEELAERLCGDDDILFLTGWNMESLYPFHVLRERRSSYRFHLLAMPPLNHVDKYTKKMHMQMIGDLSGLMSVCYTDIAAMPAAEKYDTYQELRDSANAVFAGMLPAMLEGIEAMTEESFFDTVSMSYIPVSDGFDSIISRTDDEAGTAVEEVKGMVRPVPLPGIDYMDFPDDDTDAMQRIERQPARLDGKKVCSLLREYRLKLAEMNGIEFTSEECPSTGPCAGTCEKCDREAEYLREKLSEIPVEKQKIPEYVLTWK